MKIRRIGKVGELGIQEADALLYGRKSDLDWNL